MAKITVKEIESKGIWENYILSQKPCSFLQSWNWGETNKLIGKKIFRLGFYEDGKLIGTSLIIKESARRGPHFLIPGGPILDWNDKKLVKFFLETIKDLAKKEGVWFIRVRPELLDTEDNKRILASYNFVSAPMHLHAENTWVLDITIPEEKLLVGMRKTTRYLVRKSFKLDLNVEQTTNPKYSEILFKLQKETVKRHGFVGFPKSLFKAEIEVFTKDKNATVFVCRKGKIPLACAIIIFYGGTAYYHFSASTLKYPKIQASYFLQWEIIKEAKKRGMKYYNFWGIAPNNNPKHRFAGVTLFKTGFGGERVDWIHARDLSISWKYWLTYIFETARRLFRHL